MDSKKFEAVINWPLPQNLKQLWGLLKLTGYYRRFLKVYTLIAWQLSEMLKQDSFHWTLTSERAFKQLKNALTTTPT